MSQNSFYLIVQQFAGQKSSNKLYVPTKEEHVKALADALVGNVSVYLYDKQNRLTDLTSSLGKFEKNVNVSRVRKVKLALFKSIDGKSNYNLHNLFVYKADDVPSTIDNGGISFKQNGFKDISSYENNSQTSKQENYRKKEAGDEYEKFIASKYIEQGYDVVYNGLNKGIKDNGIDLIAHNGEKVILIQCKNWQNTGYKVIYTKDIRAFFGDCFSYTLENDISTKQVAFHFITAHSETMDKSAMAYLERNKYIKYKCVYFELTT